MKKLIVLTGFLPQKRRKGDIIQELTLFFHAEMGTKIEIEDFFYLNQYNTTMVITFEKPKHKAMVFQKIQNIMELENEEGQPYYINDYLPAEIAERKQKERERYAKAKNEEKLDQEKMEWDRGRLLINNQYFTESIHVPNEKEMIKLSTERLDYIMDIKLQKSEVHENKGNKFIGYTFCPTKLSEVQDAYMKLKLIHGSARHIICSYNLPQLPWNESFGSCDDGEPRAGRILQKWMLENKLSSCAFFGVRYYGGEKIGTERFTNYLEVTKEALNKQPINTVTQEPQQATTQAKKTIKPKPKRATANSILPRKSLSQRRDIRGRRTIPSSRYTDTNVNKSPQSYAAKASPELRETNRPPFQFSRPTNALDVDEWPSLRNDQHRTSQRAYSRDETKTNASV